MVYDIVVTEDSGINIRVLEGGSEAVRLLHRAQLRRTDLLRGFAVAMGEGSSGENASSGSLCT